MRWLIAITLALSACTSDEGAKSKPTGAQQAKARKAKAKDAKPEGKDAKAKDAKEKDAKEKDAKAAKAGPAGKDAKAKGVPDGAAKVAAKEKGKGKGKGKGKVYGAKGEVMAKLQLAEKEVKNGTKTQAKLALASGEKKDSMPLGVVDGTCNEIGPQKIDDTKQALWSVSCQTAKGKTELSILQKGAAVVIAKASFGDDGTRGTYRPVRRVRLAEGAKLTRQ